MLLQKEKIDSLDYYFRLEEELSSIKLNQSATNLWKEWEDFLSNNPPKDEVWVFDDIRDAEGDACNIVEQQYEVSNYCRIRTFVDKIPITFMPLSFQQLSVHCAKVFLNFWNVKYPITEETKYVYLDCPYYFAPAVYTDQMECEGDTYEGCFCWINLKERRFDIRNMIYIHCDYKYFSFTEDLEPEWRYVDGGNFVKGIGPINTGEEHPMILKK